jgi:RNA polymerase sigma-32 factor
MAHIDDPRTQKANLTFIKASMKEPLLTRDHEVELAHRWRATGDQSALHELVRAYTRLVVSMAGRFRHYGLPVGDLVQEGNVGLMRAAARFDPGRGVRFSTYAAWWVRAAMQSYVVNNWSIVHTGTTAVQKSLFFNLRRLRARIESTGALLGDAGRQGIANALKVELAEVEQMDVRLRGDQSLGTAVGEGGQDDRQDFLRDGRPNPEEIVTSTRDGEVHSRWLAEAMGQLDPRERSIIGRRHLDERGVTLEELGRELGVSKERVRQLERRALFKLKQTIRGRAEHPSDFFTEIA